MHDQWTGTKACEWGGRRVEEGEGGKESEAAHRARDSPWSWLCRLGKECVTNRTPP